MRRVLLFVSLVALAVVACAPAAGYADAPAVAAKAKAKKGGSGWRAKATHLRGHNGSLYGYSCPGGGGLGSVYGTGVYTDDSSVCTAAVHAGRITLWRGGTVTIRIRRGSPSYRGTLRNGIVSHTWGPWAGSFKVVRGVAGPLWGATAYGRGRSGSRYTYRCPRGGRARRIYGTEVYTSDSSVCTAAVHAGSITLAGGGTVRIEIRPGESSYEESTSNGITSRSWGSWGRSFVIVGAVPAP